MATFTVEVDWTRSGTWVDETSRVRSVKTRAGFEERGDAVAGVGTAVIVVENVDGRYTPENATSPLAGNVTPRRPVRVRVGDGVTTWTIWQGWIERIEVEAGDKSARLAVLRCVDGMGLLGVEPVNVGHADSKAVADAVSEIVSLAFTPPATLIADNGDVLTHYGRAWLPERTSCLDALRDVCLAVYGRAWMARDGTVRYMTREQIQDGSGEPALTFDGASPPDGLEVAQDVDGVINRVVVTVHPPEVVGALTEIWKANSVLHLGPGVRTLGAPFRDENGERVAAVEVADLVAGTDYVVNTRRDGRGRNMTMDPNLSVSLAAEATRADIVLENNTGQALYVTLLQVRGRPIRTYDAVVVVRDDAGSQSEYEMRTAEYDLRMQASPGFAEGLASYVLVRRAQPEHGAERLRVDKSELVGTENVFSAEIMDLVSVVDAQAGVTGKYRVLNVSYELSGGRFVVDLGLERADEEPYWRLGVVGASELGQTTILGF